MNFDEGRNRYKNRNDIFSRLIHLTKGYSAEEALMILLKILEERIVVGSATEIGFIIGCKSAVCL